MTAERRDFSDVFAEEEERLVAKAKAEIAAEDAARAALSPEERARLDAEADARADAIDAALRAAEERAANLPRYKGDPEAYLAALHVAGFLYHLDDDPVEIFGEDVGERIAEDVEQLRADCAKTGTDPFDLYPPND